MASPGNPALIAHLQELIRSRGAIPFDSFMRCCLYEPGLGYYARSGTDPGQRGDFYTSVSTGPLFGRLLADFIAKSWLDHAGEEPLRILEQGAHGGQLAQDILEALRKNHNALYQGCVYGIVEPGTVLRERQKAFLSNHAPKVFWMKDLREISEWGDRSFFLSNELVDSFPVKRFVYKEDGWREGFVKWSDILSRFEPVWEVVTEASLLQELAQYQVPTVEGYQAELNLEAASWMKALSGNLKAGWILTMDYGFPGPELYSTGRSRGTLSCYATHQRDDDPFSSVGEKDITTHINFSLLEDLGAAAGWKKVFFEDQHHALIRIAGHGYLQELERRMQQNPQDQEARREVRQFQTLTHPGIMGSQFKFLLQAKGV